MMGATTNKVGCSHFGGSDTFTSRVTNPRPHGFAKEFVRQNLQVTNLLRSPDSARTNLATELALMHLSEATLFSHSPPDAIQVDDLNTKSITK
jgi:hypothetical protein